MKEKINDLMVYLFLSVDSAITFDIITSGGLSPGTDVLLHLGKIRILMDSLPIIPRWDKCWYFGYPALRLWPPLSYYFYALIGFVFNLSVFDAARYGTILSVVFGIVFMYKFAKELGLGNIESAFASILFLLAYNVYFWWEVGNFPNMISLMITPLALFAYLRAINKVTRFNTIKAGIVFFFASLIHPFSTLALAIIILFMSVLLVLLRPELIVISRGPMAPPKYTLVLPKVLVASALIAAALGMWWWFPYLVEGGSVYSLTKLPIKEDLTQMSLHVVDLRYPGRNLQYSGFYYVGVGHLVLSLGGVISSIQSKEKLYKIPLGGFLLCLAFGIAGHFSLAVLSYRWGQYMALFMSILGGIFLGYIRSFCEKKGKDKMFVVILCGLLASAYPSVIQAYQNLGVRARPPVLSKPAFIDWLEENVKTGERVATEGSAAYMFNIFTDIPQSYGGLLQDMTNEFAYTFWYYVFYRSDIYRIPYFVRNFNVRYFVDVRIPEMSEVYPGVYELDNLSSSLVEVVGSKDITVMVFGDKIDYTTVFETIASTNSLEIVLVNGGERVDKYDPETLKLFDVIYLRKINLQNLDATSKLLEEYVRGGGRLILDTSKIDETMTDLPDPFPSKRIMISTSNYNLSTVEHTSITADINFSEFAHNASFVSFTNYIYLKKGAIPVIADVERLVAVYWRYGDGLVLWTGLNLPYHAILYGKREEGKLLANMFRFVAPQLSDEEANVSFEYERPEEIKISVTQASIDDAIWVKISYYPGWIAYMMDDQTAKLPIFLAGPNMMLVFPKRTGDFEIRFSFTKTINVQIGEIVSIASAIILLAYILLYYCKEHFITSGWVKTEHRGLWIFKK